MEKIDQAGFGFKSLTEAIDTTTPAGLKTMAYLLTGKLDFSEINKNCSPT